MPSLINRALYKARRIRHKLTGSIRVLPDFLIIGVPRAGTSSLYNYLIQHPNIVPALWKEVNYFNLNYNKGVNWYKSHFPSTLIKFYYTKIKKTNFMTGEATPEYLYRKIDAKRVHDLLSNVKIILLLRNPVDRAHSDYWQSKRKGRVSLPIEEVMKNQINEKPKPIEEIDTEENNEKELYRFRGKFLFRGLYVDLVKYYLETFPNDQILILKSEDLFADPQAAFDQVLNFLKLPNFKLKKFKKFNFHDDQSKIDKKLRKTLQDYFEPHNKKLYKLLGRDFGWENMS